MKHVSTKEMNAAIKAEEIRIAPHNAIDLFRIITGKNAKIKKNRYGEMRCSAKVGALNVESIRDKLKAKGVITNADGETIHLPQFYWNLSSN